MSEDNDQDLPRYKKDNLIDCSHLLPEDIPEGTIITPIIVTDDNGKEKTAYALLTPELYDAAIQEDLARLEKEHDKLVDVVIDRGVEQAKAARSAKAPKARKTQCPDCEGSGKKYRENNDEKKPLQSRCPTCKGLGKIKAEGDTE